MSSTRSSVSNNEVKLNLIEANSCIHGHERMIIEILWLSVKYPAHPQFFLLSQTLQSIYHQAMPVLLSVPLILFPMVYPLCHFFHYPQSLLTSASAKDDQLHVRLILLYSFSEPLPKWSSSNKTQTSHPFVRTPHISRTWPKIPWHGTQALLWSSPLDFSDLISCPWYHVPYTPGTPNSHFPFCAFTHVGTAFQHPLPLLHFLVNLPYSRCNTILFSLLKNSPLLAFLVPPTKKIMCKDTMQAGF